MLGCGKFLSVGFKFVVQQVVVLLSVSPSMVLYNMSVAVVRVVEFGANLFAKKPPGHFRMGLERMGV